jgi:hypothetical protein
MNNQALKLIYNSVKHRIALDFEGFSAALKDWKIMPLSIDNEIIGGALVKGNEIHVGFGVAPKASVRAHIKQALMTVIQEHGSAVTKVASSNTKGLRFCERLGFVKLAEQDGIVLLECKGSKYVH